MNGINILKNTTSTVFQKVLQQSIYWCSKDVTFVIWCMYFPPFSCSS